MKMKNKRFGFTILSSIKGTCDEHALLLLKKSMLNDFWVFFSYLIRFWHNFNDFKVLGIFKNYIICCGH